MSENSAANEEASGVAEIPKLDIFMTFVKDNWKSVLSDLIAIAVATYIAHDLKERLKNN